MSSEATHTPLHADASRREEHVPAAYSPGRHAARTLLIASVIGGFGLGLARGAALVDWLFVPAFLVAANAIEWLVHKNPMHRPLPPRFMYKNHTLIHHRAFHHDTMEIREWRELGLVMMPWYTMLGLFVVASPIAAAGALWRGLPVAGLFYATAAGYFLLYEGLHALYHVPVATLRRWGLGGRVFRALRAHHTHHHRLDRMSFVNFNVTFPLMDWLLGTRERDGEEPVRHRA